MPTPLPITHHDNTRVKSGRNGAEFFAVSFSPTEEGWKPYEVCISRYCVPGRCDTYCFDYARPSSQGTGSHLRYSSESPEQLPKALALLAADLDKPNVVELLVEAVTPQKHLFYAQTLVNDLLACLAPKSKSYRACKKALETVRAERQKRIEERRAARVALEAAGLNPEVVPYST